MNPTLRQKLRTAIDARRRQLEGAAADGILHGTETAYKNGCRCAPCRQKAVTERGRRRRASAITAHNQPGYTGGCHCVDCREPNPEEGFEDGA